ncbi:ribosomal protection-like ABC-F family protein [Alkalihalobacillus sp. CinArs1]|uniref:ribosomal protection-like ABC-F family protein n=1 Tax=Alkalihalobacillus sp. CinArs1 TaxID=2995314 RepID=UPI0022DE7258|nr:ABC-F family ATP-binding cassette domain-containing protein [Alkalihalobacillus sp. CinArs1]
MMVCTALSISKMLGGNTVFEEITFEINEGDRVGIVGRNGSGKTTLFKLLAGVERPDEGDIHYKKGTTIGYLAQIPEYKGTARDVLNDAFSDLENLADRMKKLEAEMAKGANEKVITEYGHVLDEYSRRGGYETDSKVKTVANGLGISHLLDTAFSQLSGGEQTKVCLGLILLKEPDLLLLDEPTNHLDIDAVEWLEEFLRAYKGTVLIVSHDRYFLDEVVTKVMDLEDGELTIYVGSYSYFVQKKEEVLLAEFQAFQEQQKKIKKMKEAIKRLREWANQANPPNAALHKRARNMERALERMNKVKRPILERRKMGLEFDMANRSGKDVITFENVTAGFTSKPLLKNVDWSIRYPERVAIVGKNGSGKTTLLKVLLGQHEPADGKVVQGSSLKVGYLSQHVFEDREDARVIDVYRETAKVAEGDARHELSRFLFYGYSVFSKLSSLSGGEKMRLRLAQLMSKDINLLVLDEPTNHLDIDSREVLEDAIERFPGTIICVSHDRYLLNKCFPITYWLQEGKLYHYLESYSQARVKHIEMLSENQSDLKEGKGSKEYKEPEQKTPVKKAATIEEEVEQIEEGLYNLEDKLLRTSDHKELETLYREKEKMEEKRNELYELLQGEVE